MIYSFSVQSDTASGTVNLSGLQFELKESQLEELFSHITRNDDVLSIHFSDQLSEQLEQTLDEIISNHTGSPAPDFFINELVLDAEQKAQLQSDQKARDFSNKLTAILKVLNKSQGMNLSQSLWAHHRLRAMEIEVNQTIADAHSVFLPLLGQTIKIDVLNLVITGDIETAYFVFSVATPDPMTESYHSISQQMLDFMRNQLGIYLGWESPA
jgi:hypothetical protein